MAYILTTPEKVVTALLSFGAATLLVDDEKRNHWEGNRIHFDVSGTALNFEMEGDENDEILFLAKRIAHTYFRIKGLLSKKELSFKERQKVIESFYILSEFMLDREN